MCCDGWYLEEGEEADGECPDCGMETLDGSATEGCSWSPVDCQTCGAAPCDQSC